MSVSRYVRPYVVRTSIPPQKVFPTSPDPSSRSRSQPHRACEVPKIALLQVYHFHHLQWKLANDH